MPKQPHLSHIPVSQWPKYLNTAEAAQLLRTTPATLTTQRCTRRVPTPPYIKRGKTVLYDRDAILAWMTSQEVR